ncbi:MAG: hypothetical protein KDA21_10585, partial [Phycisphaerales bacterium]|nr:hypothetical protein [Phycisphaerales bacterium]
MNADAPRQQVSTYALLAVMLAVSSTGLCLITTALALFWHAQAAVTVVFLPLLGLAAAILGWMGLRQIAS